MYAYYYYTANVSTRFEVYFKLYKFGFDPHKLLSLRSIAGLTQADMAKSLNITRTAYSRWEQGQSDPRKEHVEALAKVLNVDPQVFFEREATPRVQAEQKIGPPEQENVELRLATDLLAQVIEKQLKAALQDVTEELRSTRRRLRKLERRLEAVESSAAPAYPSQAGASPPLGQTGSG